MEKSKAKQKRKVLVILSNRFSRTLKPRFLELDCKADGTIIKEAPIKSQPRKAIYDEVWENDEGKTSLDSCTRIKRKYRHALEKKPAA